MREKQPLADPQARASSSSSGQPPQGGFAHFVPELSVTDLDESLRFWCALLGFEVAYDRPAARFAYLAHGTMQVMLCQVNGRWETGELQRPFGRGINFQMSVAQLDPILTALKSSSWPLYEDVRDQWYRVGDMDHGRRECLVQDPDGYLVRLSEPLGIRPAATAIAQPLAPPPS